MNAQHMHDHIRKHRFCTDTDLSSCVSLDEEKGKRGIWREKPVVLSMKYVLLSYPTSVGLRFVRDGEEISSSFDFVLAADGANSAVRLVAGRMHLHDRNAKHRSTHPPHTAESSAESPPKAQAHFRRAWVVVHDGMAVW